MTGHLQHDDREAWLAGVRDADGPARVVDLPIPPAAVADLYPVLDWSAFWASERERVDWLCEPLLLAGRATALFSPAKAGKSLLCLEVAAALATGRPVLGNPSREPLNVLYVDLENTEDDLRERLTALGYGPDSALDRLRYLSFPALPVLDSPLGGQHIAAVADHHDARLVIIDTVSRVISGEENSADTFRALYRHAIMPLKAAGRAVLRLDHAGKDLTAGQRGSSAKVDDVDAVWSLTARPGGAIELRCTHRRHNHGADQISLLRLSDPLGHAVPGCTDVLTDDVRPVLELLDELDVPVEWGRDKARGRLTRAGKRVRNELLAEALRVRKRLADESGQVRDEQARWTGSGHVPRASGDSVELAGQPCPGRATDRAGQAAAGAGR